MARGRIGPNRAERRSALTRPAQSHSLARGTSPKGAGIPVSASRRRTRKARRCWSPRTTRWPPQEARRRVALVRRQGSAAGGGGRGRRQPEAGAIGGEKAARRAARKSRARDAVILGRAGASNVRLVRYAMKARECAVAAKRPGPWPRLAPPTTSRPLGSCYDCAAWPVEARPHSSPAETARPWFTSRRREQLLRVPHALRKSRVSAIRLKPSDITSAKPANR